MPERHRDVSYPYRRQNQRSFASQLKLRGNKEKNPYARRWYYAAAAAVIAGHGFCMLSRKDTRKGTSGRSNA